MISLKREFALYQQRPIASCPHIRTLHDLVGSFDSPRSILTEEDTPCLVLEWMENDLRSISRKKFREKPNILKVIARSVLCTLAMLKKKCARYTQAGLLPLISLQSAEESRHKSEQHLYFRCRRLSSISESRRPWKWYASFSRPPPTDADQTSRIGGFR